MTRNKKVALIGCGRIAGHHCMSIDQVEGLELAAVCDLVKEKAANYGEQYNVPFFVNYHEMFEAVPDIDAAAIITPSGMHYEHSMEIMRLYRKHLIVEKPTFMRPSQVREVFKVGRELGIQIFPVFQNRHNLAVQRVRKALSSGELGKIRIASVRVRWCRPQRYYDMAPWRGTFAQDGGALTNQGIHHVDLLRNLGGEVEKVNATMRTLGAKIEVEDTVVGHFTYSSGAIGALEVTTAARPDNFEASLSFVCENGLAQLGGIAVNELQIFTPNPAECSVCSEDFSGNVYGHGHVQIYKDISDFFHKGVPFSVDESDDFNTIQLLNAFYYSDEQGDWVQVKGGVESPRLGREDDKLANLYRTPKPGLMRSVG